MKPLPRSQARRILATVTLVVAGLGLAGLPAHAATAPAEEVESPAPLTLAESALLQSGVPTSVVLDVETGEVVAASPISRAQSRAAVQSNCTGLS